jgi:hypothetical protein
MPWIFATAALVLAAIYVPGFRKVVLVIGGAVGVFAFIALFAEFDRPPAFLITQTSPIKKLPVRPPKRMPTEQIEVGELRPNFETEGVSSINLRIHNDSAADTLASADYKLLIDDCQGTEAEPAHCATLSDDKGTIVLEVPPKQTRDVTIITHETYSSAAMLGHPRVKMIITAARAKRTTLDRVSDGRTAEVIPDAQNGEGNRRHRP